MYGTTSISIVIIAESTPAMASLQARLAKNGYTVSKIDWLDCLPRQFHPVHPELVILSDSETDSSVLFKCRRLRSWYSGAVMVLSPADGGVNEIDALEAGADDYLRLPGQIEVTLARVKSLLRRRPIRSPAMSDDGHNGRSFDKEIHLSEGVIVIDPVKRCASYKNRLIELTAAEFDLLWYLACRPDRVVTRDEIYPDLLGMDYDGQNRIIDVRVARLRKKIKSPGNSPEFIRSVRSYGYMLVTAF